MRIIRILLLVALIIATSLLATSERYPYKTLAGVQRDNMKVIRFITWQELPHARTSDFYVMGFVGDEYLLGYQKVKDPKLISQGRKSRLYVIPLKGRGVKVYFIPLFNVQQYVPLKGASVLLIGNNGTQLGKFYLRTGKYERLFAVERGKPGFKMTGFTTTDSKGNIYVEGFFFDENQVAEGPDNYFVRLDLSKRGLKVFAEKVVDTTKVLERVAPVRMFYWGSIDFCVMSRFVGKYPQEVYAYYKGNIKRVDRREYVLEIAASRNYTLLYLAKVGKRSYMFIKDLSSGKSWKVGAPMWKPFMYPFLSADGELAVVSNLNFKDKIMDFWYALRRENYKLRKFLDDVPPGSMKLSEDGKYFSLLNKEGLLVGELLK